MRKMAFVGDPFNDVAEDFSTPCQEDERGKDLRSYAGTALGRRRDLCFLG